MPLRPRRPELRIRVHHEVQVLLAEVLAVDHHNVVPVHAQPAVHIDIDRLISGVPLLAVAHKAEAVPVLRLGPVRLPHPRLLLRVRLGEAAEAVRESRNYQEGRVPINQGSGGCSRKREPGSRCLGPKRLADHLQAHTDGRAQTEFERPGARAHHKRLRSVLHHLRYPTHLFHSVLAHLEHLRSHLGREPLAHLDHAAYVRAEGYLARTESAHLDLAPATDRVVLQQRFRDIRFVRLRDKGVVLLDRQGVVLLEFVRRGVVLETLVVLRLVLVLAAQGLAARLLDAESIAHILERPDLLHRILEPRLLRRVQLGRQRLHVRCLQVELLLRHVELVLKPLHLDLVAPTQPADSLVQDIRLATHTVRKHYALVHRPRKPRHRE